MSLSVKEASALLGVAPRTMPTQLYRHFDAAGTLLYVGVSLSTVGRLAQHKADSAWSNRIAKVTIEYFRSRAEAFAAEAAAIEAEKPVFNVAGTKPAKKVFRSKPIHDPQKSNLRATFLAMGIVPKDKK